MIRRGLAADLWLKVLSKFNKKETVVAPCISVDSMLKEGRVKVVPSEKIEEGYGCLVLNEKDANKFAEKGVPVFMLKSESHAYQMGKEVPKTAFQSFCDRVTGRRQRELEENVRRILMCIEDIKNNLENENSDGENNEEWNGNENTKEDENKNEVRRMETR